MLRNTTQILRNMKESFPPFLSAELPFIFLSSRGWYFLKYVLLAPILIGVAGETNLINLCCREESAVSECYFWAINRKWVLVSMVLLCSALECFFWILLLNLMLLSTSFTVAVCCVPAVLISSVLFKENSSSESFYMNNLFWLAALQREEKQWIK